MNPSTKEREESRRALPPPHSSAPRDMRPLDVGTQPVWSSILCCVGTETGNLRRASHVWDQARCRGTQSPTSCLQGLPGYYCRRKIPQPAGCHNRARPRGALEISLEPTQFWPLSLFDLCGSLPSCPRATREGLSGAVQADFSPGSSDHTRPSPTPYPRVSA